MWNFYKKQFFCVNFSIKSISFGILGKKVFFFKTKRHKFIWKHDIFFVEFFPQKNMKLWGNFSDNTAWSLLKLFCKIDQTTQISVQQCCHIARNYCDSGEWLSVVEEAKKNKRGSKYEWYMRFERLGPIALLAQVANLWSFKIKVNKKYDIFTS